jgi:hypothetical protein
MLLTNGDTPPKSDDPVQVNRWWEKAARCKNELEANPRKKAAITRKLDKKNSELGLLAAAANDPMTKQRDSYRMVRSALKGMSGPEKMAWLDDFVGYCMTEAGIGSRKSFAPQAIPDEYKQGRGRPRLLRDDMAESA